VDAPAHADAVPHVRSGAGRQVDREKAEEMDRQRRNALVTAAVLVAIVLAIYFYTIFRYVS